MQWFFEQFVLSWSVFLRYINFKKIFCTRTAHDWGSQPAHFENPWYQWKGEERFKTVTCFCFVIGVWIQGIIAGIASWNQNQWSREKPSSNQMFWNHHVWKMIFVSNAAAKRGLLIFLRQLRRTSKCNVANCRKLAIIFREALTSLRIVIGASYIYIYRSQSKNSRNFPIVGGIFLKIATYLIHVENTPQEETCKASTENGTAALENYAEFLTSVRI